MKIKNFFVLFEQEKDGGYSVSVPSLPGCFSQGDTFEEATKNIKEAIELYLEKRPTEGLFYFEILGAWQEFNSLLSYN